MNGAIRILRIAQRLRKNPYAVKPKPHSEHLQLLDPGTGFFPIHDGNSSPTRSRYCPANSSRVISDLSRRSLSCCTTSLGAFSKKPELSSLPLERFKSTLIFLILVSNRSRSLSTSTRPVRSRKARTPCPSTEACLSVGTSPREKTTDSSTQPDNWRKESACDCRASARPSSSWRRYTRPASLRATPSSSRVERRPVSYTHLRAHETDSYLVCRLLLEKKKKKKKY